MKYFTYCKVTLFSLIIILPVILCCQTREPVVADAFYPANPAELSSLCNKYLSNVGMSRGKSAPFGIIVPHAGYVYSGQVAAYGFKELSGHEYDVVFVISPSHVVAFSYASVYSGDYYKTPLGKLKIEKDLAAKCVTKDGLVKLSTKGHLQKSVFERGEHAIEVELPFIQILFNDIPIVPIVIGSMDYDVINALGQKLGEITESENILIIASSDLSHFHPYSECKKIDSHLITELRKMNPNSFYRGLRSGNYEACGGAAITAMLIAAKKSGKDNIEILKYANSGDIPNGDKSRVVGYLSAVIYKNNKLKERDMRNEVNLSAGELSVKEQLFVLKLAEETVNAVVTGNQVPEPKDIPDIVKEKRGAFVTLEKNGQLRGCIGYVLPIKQLYETIIDVATSAALKDPRFSPVSEGELKNITVEVSVLTVPETITDPKKIVVGKHGIIMKQGYNQGLLLPQVATDYGWDRETFLEHTCKKAWLPSDAWKDEKTEIQIFSAQVFNRESLGIDD